MRLVNLIVRELTSSSPRWHEQRRRFKRAEVEGDARDAKAEAQQAAALQKQADDFLALQAESLGMPSARTPATSTSILPVNAGDEPLVKLMALPKAVAKPPPIVRNAAMLLAAQEEEDASKVRRTLVKLNYSDDEEDRHSKNSGGTSRAREKRERETRAAVPETQEQLWSYVVDWSALSEVRPCSHPLLLANQTSAPGLCSRTCRSSSRIPSVRSSTAVSLTSSVLPRPKFSTPSWSICALTSRRLNSSKSLRR